MLLRRDGRRTRWSRPRSRMWKRSPHHSAGPIRPASDWRRPISQNARACATFRRSADGRARPGAVGHAPFRPERPHLRHHHCCDEFDSAPSQPRRFQWLFSISRAASITEGQAGVRRLLPECGHAQWRSRQASIGRSDCPRYARQDHCRGDFRYDPLTQISHVDWYWSTPEKKDFWKTPLQMRNIFPQEMPLLIASGGLRLVERFGDFDRSPLVPGSVRQVCVCDCPG